MPRVYTLWKHAPQCNHSLLASSLLTPRIISKIALCIQNPSDASFWENTSDVNNHKSCFSCEWLSPSCVLKWTTCCFHRVSYMFEPRGALVSPGFFPRSGTDHCHPLPDSVSSPEKQGPFKTAELPWKHAHYPRQSHEF